MLIGKGILTWDGKERREGRYGALKLNQETFKNDVKRSDTYLDTEAVKSFKGRVRITCKVLETRESGHIGDVFLGIRPSTPEMGEVIEVGVGLPLLEKSWDDIPSLLLTPEDGRLVNWIDPRILYRLHDQTVELYAETTEDPCHPAPDLEVPTEEGVHCFGDDSFQVKNVDPETLARVIPKVIPLGDGVFMLGLPEGPVEYTKKK